MATARKYNHNICIYFTKLTSKFTTSKEVTLKEHQHEMEDIQNLIYSNMLLRKTINYLA